MTEPTTYTDDKGEQKPLAGFWKISTTSVIWLKILNNLSAKHGHKGVVTGFYPDGSMYGNVFYLDPAVYSAADIGAALGQGIPEGKTEITLKDRKEWAQPVPSTVAYFGDA